MSRESGVKAYEICKKTTPFSKERLNLSDLGQEKILPGRAAPHPATKAESHLKGKALSHVWLETAFSAEPAVFLP